MWAAGWDPSTSTWIKSSNPEPFSLQDQGIVFVLNFNKTFSMNANFGDVFTNWTTGPVTSNPPFRNGFMFADEYEFYTFGYVASPALV